MKKVKKIDGFTLMELVVVMALTSIVVGIVYSIFSIVGNQFRHSQSYSEQLNELALFRKTLSNDFEEADSIKYSSDTLRLYSQDTAIYYNFEGHQVLRVISNKADSIDVELASIEITHQSKKEDIVESIYMELIAKNDTLSFQFEKLYAANTFINYGNKY